MTTKISYDDFLKSKRITHTSEGIETSQTHPMLYPFQEKIVDWALRKGRAAIFADCGLGKTPIQLYWAAEVHSHTRKPILIVAPLAVSQQTKREGVKFGVDVHVVRDQSDVKMGVNITNYEMIEHFDSSKFGGLVLDESSILKSYGGKFRKFITEWAERIPYRLACTATPAPNDLIELINHAEFLGVLGGKEAIALFFIQDGNTTHKWRIKGHAQDDFWAWVASWAMAIRAPSDLGFDDGDFVLPALNVTQHDVDGHINEGFLVPMEARTLQEQQQARRESLPARVAQCAEMANATAQPCLVWCGLNIESEALAKAIHDAVEVKGSDSNDDKAARMLGFSDGQHRVLVTKPSIAGFGMNWQHCNKMAFVGLSHSFEQYYQAVRRCWRFGQTRDVDAHVIVANTEGAVVDNIKRKEQQAASMMRDLVKHMGGEYEHMRDDSRYEYRKAANLPNFVTL
jgi:hypothetical protein